MQRQNIGGLRKVCQFDRPESAYINGYSIKMETINTTIKKFFTADPFKQKAKILTATHFTKLKDIDSTQLASLKTFNNNHVTPNI